jgi:hypothetical protein
MKKGKILLSYDTGRPVGHRNEIVQRYDVPRDADEKTFRDYEWMLFKDNLTDLLRDRNPENNWESNEYPGSYLTVKDVYHHEQENFKTMDEDKLKFKLKGGDDLLHKFSLHKFPDFFGEWKINIYSCGKDGLYLESRQDQNVDHQKIYESATLLLKACKTGFHRDWERDGICIKNTKRLLTPEEDANLAEREEERRHDRAIKRHQDYAESGGEE